MRRVLRIMVFVLGGLYLFGSGCASLREWRIDPTGNCIFTRQQSGVSPNTSGESGGTDSVANPSATSPSDGATPFQPGTTVGVPSTETSSATNTSPYPYSGSPFPGGVGSPVPGTGLGNFRGGVGNLDGRYAGSAPAEPIQGPAIYLAPKIHIAPINSEIVVVASYLGKDEYLRTNQIVDWSLDGAGHILSYDTGSWCDWFHLDFTSAKMLADRSVRTKTSANLWTIDRGTADTKDDVEILKGQTWITVKSTREGTSYISAVAPSINDWAKRSAGATIHWVDAQFSYPRPARSPLGGTRTLTTIVSRQSDGAPRAGWFVEYEIQGGPPAGLGEANYQRMKVPTDASGKAEVALHQTEAVAGTSTVAIRIIRPASSEGSDSESVVDSRILRHIWSGGSVLSIDVASPQEVGLSSSRKVTVRNHSANPVGATVRLHLDPGFSYVSSSAPPVPSTIRTSTLQWEISAIPPMGVYEMTVDLDADKTVVGAGKYMKVRGEVIQRDHSRPGTVVAPPPEVVTPEPEPPAPTENTTGGSSGGSYGGLPSGIPADGVKLSYYVGRRINTLDGFIGFEDMESPYVFGGENTWLVLGIENHTGKEVKDLYLVINQPREGNYLTDALRKGSQPGEMPNNAKIDEKGRTVRHFPSIPPVENGVVEYENKATLSVYFEPLKSRSNVLISAHVISENKDNPIQKTLTISTSVAP